jgi:two-component system OmpR family sensor kinase
MMSIRMRMTLLYSAILALTLVMFSTVLYTIQGQYTLNMVKRDLSSSTQSIVLAWTRPRGAPEQDRSGPKALKMGSLPGGSASSTGSSGLLEGILRELRTRDTVRVLAADGQVLQSAGNQDEDLPLSDEELQYLQRGQVVTEIATMDQERWLVYSQPVTLSGQVVGIVQAARSLADRDRSLQGLGVTLILGSLFTTAIAFGGGWMLSGMTLRPIGRIAQTAQKIGQECDFASRVDYRGPNDELGQLATTFDAMLSRLQEAYQQVTHTLQVQRDFVADVSHELRTPLTTIRGNLALLSHTPPVRTEERQDILADAAGETERLIRLVSDLLTLARMDSGRKLEREPVDVKALAEDTCRQMQQVEPDRAMECVGSESGIAMADHDALKQVLLILLDNAIKHTDGAIRVGVGSDDRQVTVSVQDGGPGMSPELRERIFDRFYRGDASRSTPGFGLGLSIARALVEAQGGTLSVESEIGAGSTFMVRIPASDSSQPVVKPLPCTRLPVVQAPVPTA